MVVPGGWGDYREGFVTPGPGLVLGPWWRKQETGIKTAGKTVAVENCFGGMMQSPEWERVSRILDEDF